MPNWRRAGWEFIDLAERGVNTWRSYVFVLLWVVLSPLAFVLLVGAALGVWATVQHNWDAIGPILAMTTQFGSIIVAGAALLFAVERYHRRPWRSLVAPDPRLDS